MTVKRVLKIALSAIIVCALVLSVFVYVRYVEIKKALIAEMSQRAAEITGHKIEISDFSLGLTDGIDIRGVSVSNPDGKGRLFAAKRIRIDQRTGDLLSGDFNLNSIVLIEPELTLVKDAAGRLNISEKLMSMLTKKSEKKKASFRIDSLKITDGAIRYGSGAHTAIEKINLTASGISSDPGRKATFSLRMLHGGINAVAVDGWAFAGDELKKFGAEGRCENFRFGIFRELAKWYGIDVERLAADTAFSVKGDMNLFSLETETSAKIGSQFLKKPDTVRISSSLDVRLSEKAVTVKKAVLSTGAGSAISIRGVIDDLGGDPKFSLDTAIRAFDLSALNLLQGVELGGLLDAENLRLAGSAKDPAKKVSGGIRLSRAFFRRQDTKIENIAADMTFPGEGLSARCVATADISAIAGRSSDNPVTLSVTADAVRRSEGIDLSAKAGFSPARITLNEGNVAQYDAASVRFAGRLSPGSVKGSVSSDISGLKAAGFTASKLAFAADFSYGNDRAGLTNLSLDAGFARAGAGLVTVLLDKRKKPRAVDLKNVSFNWPAKETDLRGLSVSSRIAALDRFAGTAEFSLQEGKVAGIPLSNVAGKVAMDGRRLSVEMPDAKAAGGSISLKAALKSFNEPFPASVDFSASNLSLDSFGKAAGIFSLPVAPQGMLTSVSLSLKADSRSAVFGKASMDAKGVSVMRLADSRKLIADAMVNGSAEFSGKDATIKGSFASGNVKATADGIARDFMTPERFIRVQIIQPETPLVELRNSFWDVFPDKLLYAGLDGSISTELRLRYGRNRMGAAGEIRLKNCLLEGENKEFTIGRINGIVPVNYSRDISDQPQAALPQELSELDKVRRAVAASRANKEASRITIDSISYGFDLVKNLQLWVKQQGTVLTIEKFNATIAGGAVNGVVVVDTAKGVQYRTGIELKEISLKKLCEDITPIKGYLSGKVDGVAAFKGEGSNLRSLLGKADFYTYSAKGEKTRISKEFLQKLGGPKIKAYIGNRSFDKGVISLYTLNGDIIFRELEISNRNIFGVRDLSVTVAPYNNRIAIDDLMWSLTTAAQRAAAKSSQ